VTSCKPRSAASSERKLDPRVSLTISQARFLLSNCRQSAFAIAGLAVPARRRVDRDRTTNKRNSSSSHSGGSQATVLTISGCLPRNTTAVNPPSEELSNNESPPAPFNVSHCPSPIVSRNNQPSAPAECMHSRLHTQPGQRWSGNCQITISTLRISRQTFARN